MLSVRSIFRPKFGNGLTLCQDKLENLYALESCSPVDVSNHVILLPWLVLCYMHVCTLFLNPLLPTHTHRALPSLATTIRAQRKRLLTL